MAKKSAKIAVGDRVRATMSPAYSVVVVTLMGEVTKLGTLDGVKIAMVRVDDPTELVLPFALGSCTKIS